MVLDKNDFECLAVRNTVIEGKGDWNEATFKKNQEVMANLWNEIAELADFNKDGEVSTDEFMKAIQTNCVGKSFNDFPNAFKIFISGAFQAIDVDGDGSVFDRIQSRLRQQNGIQKYRRPRRCLQQVAQR